MPTKFHLARLAFGLAIFGAFLAGCSAVGTGPSLVGNPFAVTQRMELGLPATRHSLRSAWLKRPPTGRLVLYVAQAFSEVDVFNYPGGRVVGRVTGFETPSGLCSDSEGNVYVTDGFASAAYEIQHATLKVINSWKNIQGIPRGCSVSAGGDLAIGVSGFGTTSGGSQPDFVMVFPGGGQSGTEYAGPKDHIYPPAYDAKGNLFVESYNCTPPYCPATSSVYELPAGGSSWEMLTLKGAIIHQGGAIELMGSQLGLGDNGAGPPSNGSFGIYSAKLRGTKLTVSATTLLAPDCPYTNGNGDYRLFAGAWGNHSQNPNGLQTDKVTRIIASNGEGLSGCSARIDTFNFPAGGDPVKFFFIKRAGYYEATTGSTLIRQ